MIRLGHTAVEYLGLAMAVIYNWSPGVQQAKIMFFLHYTLFSCNVAQINSFQRYKLFWEPLNLWHWQGTIILFLGTDI